MSITRRPLSEAERARLEHMLSQRYTYRRMAAEVGVCVDTLKRILMREELVFFEGAKYVPNPHKRYHHWRRPCMRCGATDPRPKGQYICDDCKDPGAEALPDSWLEADL